MRLALLIATVMALATVSALPARAESAAAAATDIRVAGDLAHTRFVVDVTKPVEPKAFLLTNPERVVIELPEVTFTMTGLSQHAAGGIVSAFRFGLIAPGKSRIVLDLAQPATIEQLFVMPPVDDQPARLVLDLAGTDEATFRAAVAAQPRAGPLAPPAGPAAVGGDALPLVVLDPGHGGIDSGAVTSAGDQEKTIVLEIAQMLAAKIEKAGRYRVLLTRSNDTFISLGDRVKIAREAKAALFVSIHADTLPDPFGVRGATVYTLSEKASDAEAERYAEKENRSDAIAGVDLTAEPDEVADILIDLTRRETKAFSMRFAHGLAEEIRTAAALNKNPIRSAGFRVLRAADVPSALLELGYLSNAQDAKLLMSAEWREKTTDAVLRSIDAFFAATGDKAPAKAKVEESGKVN